MQQNRNSKSTSRMASAVSMAKAQPPRGNVAQPSRAAGSSYAAARSFNGQVDPQWQQKLSGGSRFPPSSVFRPSSVATNNSGQRSDSNFSSSSIGNANRRRPGQQNGGFDAKLFLRQQQKGQYLHAPSNAATSAPAATTNATNGAKKSQGATTVQPWQQPAPRQFTPSMDPKAFDIEQFKAMQPRRALLQPNLPMQQQQQQQKQQQQHINMQQQQQQQRPVAQQWPQSTAPSTEQQSNATDNDDDDDNGADEPTAALPWQTAKQNLEARPAKVTTSKEILQQMAAMRNNAAPTLGAAQTNNVSVVPEDGVPKNVNEQS